MKSGEGRKTAVWNPASTQSSTVGRKTVGGLQQAIQRHRAEQGRQSRPQDAAGLP